MRLAILSSALLFTSCYGQQRPGYKDTPILQEQKWRVHDAERPAPPVVTPASEPGAPPSDAIVLFDGKDISNWVHHNGDEQVPGRWKVENGYMEVAPGTGDLWTKQEFGDCQLHIEWMTPSVIKGSSQERGNSGVFLMGRYEIQVLDSFENPTYSDGQAGAIYGQWPPLVNASRRPGEWQSYDIIFEAPRFSADGTVTRPGFVTVIHNGVVLHHRKRMNGPMVHKQLAYYTWHDEAEPLRLQDHGSLVRFRNIWYRPLRHYDDSTKPAETATDSRR
ncbi:MAG TPA: DUF1080 domain-containing protein [Bryobacteraceae bacterium]|nr:DUF1080 domain-containing protein [Bryobacteraceae bacterium]